jgi:hypothetical protein
VLIFAVLTAGSGTGLADDAHNKPADPPLDDELLEFLGSVDTVPGDYFSQVDVRKVAAKPANPTAANPTVVAAKPATPTTSSAPTQNASGAKQNE